MPFRVMPFSLILFLLMTTGHAPSVLAARPSHLWSQRFGDGNTQSARGIAVDGSGNVFVTGSFQGTVDFGGGPLTSAGSDDIFLAKFSPAGSHLWSRCYGDANAQYAYGVAVDGSGNVFVTGYYRGTVDFGGGRLTSAGGYDVLLAKLDANGGHLWSRRYGDASDQFGEDAATDGSGNVLVTGYFRGTVDFGGGSIESAGTDDIFRVKFDANGNHLWSKGHGDGAVQYAFGIAVDGSGNVFITGNFRGAVDFGGGLLTSAGSSDIFLAKFDASGNYLWSGRYGDRTAQYGQGVAVDASGNPVITGAFQGTVDFGGGVLTSAGLTDIYVARFDSKGDHLWSHNYGDEDSQYGSAVAIDGSGNPFVTGYFKGTVDFGGGPLTCTFLSDIFLVQLDMYGDHLWSQSFGDLDDQSGYSVAVDGLGNVAVTGFFKGSIDFGGGPLTSAGSRDIFLAKFGSPATAADAPRVSLALFQNAPNPFNPTTVISFMLPEESDVALSIFNAEGKLIKTLVDGLLPRGLTRVPWNGTDTAGNQVGSGVYFYRLSSGSEAISRTMVLLR